MYYIYTVQYLVKQRWERCDSNAAGDTHTGVVPVYITHGAAEGALYEQSAIMKRKPREIHFLFTGRDWPWCQLWRNWW